MEFRILGPIEAVDGERSISLGGPKQRALLAALLLHANQLVSRDRLIDDLWGGEAPANASHTLNVHLSQLRKTLTGADGGSPIASHPSGGYLLRVEPGQLDIHRFEDLVETAREATANGDPASASNALGAALALWRGSPLSELGYESFAQPAIARLDELRLLAIQDRIDADLQLGRHAALVPELEAHVGASPLVERFRGQLMLALYRSDRQADALRVYKAARTVLLETLGLEPSPTLQKLERDILRHDAELNVRGSHEQGSMPSVPAAPSSEERSILVAAIDECELDPLIELAEPLARSALSRNLILAQLVTPEGDALNSAIRAAHERRATLIERGIATEAVAFTSSERGVDLVRLASEQSVDLLLMQLDRRAADTAGFAADTRAVLEGAPCDVALLAPKPRTVDGTGVVVAFGGAEHDWAALELAAWCASATGNPLKLVGSVATEQVGARDSSRLLAHASIVVQRFIGIPAEPLLTEPGYEGLLSASDGATLLVLGLASDWREVGLGRTRALATAGSKTPVLLVRRGSQSALSPSDTLTRFRWSLTPSPLRGGAAPGFGANS